MKKVSVIIPVYNVEPYIEECLGSVLTQTLSDLEVILIHDHGSDQSFEKARRIMKSYPQDMEVIYLENDRNLGLSTTRNRGINHACGKYLYFLDSDDMIRPDAMEMLYQRAEAENLDLQIFGASFIYETEELKARFQTNRAVFKQDYPDVLTGKELYKLWMKAWDWMPSQPRFFYKTAFLKENGIRFADGMLHEDEAFTFQALMAAERVRVTNDPLFIRRFRAHSIMSSTPTVKNVSGCVEILKTVSAYPVKDPELKDAIRYYQYKILKDVAGKYRRAKAADPESVKQLPKEILRDPEARAIWSLVEALQFGEIKDKL